MLFIKFPSTPNASVWHMPQSPKTKQHLFVLLALFYKEYLNPQNGMQTDNYQPSPSGLTVRLHPLMFLQTLQGFISLQNISQIFLLTCLSHWLVRIFKFMVFMLLEKAFANQKMNLDIFTDVSQTKFFPRFLLSPPGRGKLLIPPGSFFFENLFSCSRKEVGEAIKM